MNFIYAKYVSDDVEILLNKCNVYNCLFYLLNHMEKKKCNVYFKYENKHVNEFLTELLKINKLLIMGALYVKHFASRKF